MSVINLLHTIPEFREVDYQLRSLGIDLNEVMANLDFQTVSIAAVVVALGVIAYSFLAKGPSGGFLGLGKSLDNSIDGGKAWHDTREFGFRSLSGKSTDVTHDQVLDALSNIMGKWDSEDDSNNDEDVTAAPLFDTESQFIDNNLA